MRVKTAAEASVIRKTGEVGVEFSEIYGVKLPPHHPSSSICAHVAVNLDGLGVLPSYVDGVEARAGLSVQ